MKYTVQKLDKRFSYSEYFKYYIGFSHRMSNSRGPLEFTRVQKWFVNTHGWSAEIRQWAEIRAWYNKSMPLMAVQKNAWARQATSLPEECNPLWSWTNGTDDLRIYLKDEPELSFFQLAHPLSNS